MKNILIIILMLLSNYSFSQLNNYYNSYQINDPVNDPITAVRDIVFQNPTIGYVIADYNQSYNTNICKIYKTTNYGQNWIKICSFNLNQGYGDISFSIKGNVGYIVVQHQIDRIFKTTDSGYSFQEISTSIYDPSYQSVLSVGINKELYRLVKESNKVSELDHPIIQYPPTYFYTYYFPTNIILYHIEVSNISNTVYVCGAKNNGNPFLAKSTNNGRNYSIIKDGSDNPNGIGKLYHMSFYYEGNNEVLKISGVNGLAEYNNNSFNVLSSSWGTNVYRKISFYDTHNGFYIEDNVPTLYLTTNGGINWINDYQGLNSFSITDRFFTFGKIAYFLETNGTNAAPGIFHSRNLNEVLATYHDNISTSGSFKIDNNPYTTTNSYIIRGGIYPLWTEPIDTNQSEKIFYRWTFNNMNNSVNNYELFYDGELAAHYKTKQKADNAWAINNANQTKAIRDTNNLNNNPLNLIHQVHESIGGIFYTRSTNGGTNWSREEVVNIGFSPNDATGNRNPSIAIKRRDFKPLTISDQERNVAIVWEKYNQSNGKIEIQTADRVEKLIPGTGYEWKRTEYENGNTVFASFDCSSYPSFISTPKIFVSSPLTDLRHSVVIVPHLEKNNTTGKVKVVVTIRYNLEKLDYIVDNGEDGMISNLAVSSPFNYFNNSDLYDLNIVYQKDNTINNIVYKKVRAGKEMIGLFANTIETEENLGSLDGMRARFTPDISVQNGLPVVTYCGNYYDYRIIQYEDETVSDNMMSLLNHTTITLFKTTNNGAWSEYVRFTGLNPQENPNVEGSKNAMAYLLSFRKNGSYFQYVKINGLSQYYCTPESYNETDAKFVRGSYIGQFGSNYNPLLLTLSNPDANSRYTIGHQPFSISNIGSGTDGYNNLDATIEIDNTAYSLTLGPIIASNTTYGFEDDTPPQTVHNPVEFNETMVSAVFSLSDNDTLLIGAHGKYTTADSKFEPLKYHVDLVNASTMEIHRELFRDTINIEDSVGIEFLRGYIINDIPNGTDQFYVQMVVDTVDPEDGDYGLTGVYEDDTPPKGDNPVAYKTKIFFENSKSSLTSGNQIPKNYELSQNYPNPFNPVTKINFALPKQGFVSLKIYDITGREIQTLVNEVKQAGYYTVNFNGSNLSSGVYFYRIQSGDFVQTKRMVILK